MRPRPMAPAVRRMVVLLAAALALLLPGAPTAGARPRAEDASACALAGTTGWTDEGHDTDYSVFQRPTGTKKIAMIFVDFPDAPATESPSEDAAQLTPGADWVWQASYGRTWLDITPYQRWVRMPRNSTDYGYARGLSHEQHEAYVADAVRAADPYVDFSGYDMVYVVATRNAPAISFTPTYVYDPGTPGVVADGTRIRYAVTFGQDMWHWGPKLLGHETAHTFGLPDLYAFDTRDDGHRFTGGWDVMGLISGAAPQYFGWQSWKLGWTDDDQVVCRTTAGSDTVELSAVEYQGGTKLAVVRTGPTSAYVVESRRAVRNDQDACATGALIYKVDSSVKTGEGPIRVVNAQPGAAPEGNCRTLDHAPWTAGQSFSDDEAGVRIEVLDDGGYGDTVRVTKV
ncbi:M6 family metalloprotease domain-containing protein [Streptomyces sp. NPDC052396]|uniref:M6 family metalloprotease domain-containing protein n=1 Tax=Streptomyces sp. NPDC052396 TaxID=3365689 RepID=UPI0037D2A583